MVAVKEERAVVAEDPTQLEYIVLGRLSYEIESGCWRGKSENRFAKSPNVSEFHYKCGRPSRLIIRIYSVSEGISHQLIDPESEKEKRYPTESSRAFTLSESSFLIE
jgi:hypothetical protein